MSILAGKASRVLIGIILALVIVSGVLVASLLRFSNKLALEKHQKKTLALAYDQLNEIRNNDLKKLREREHERRELRTSLEVLQDEHRQKRDQTARQWGDNAVPGSYRKLMRDATQTAASLSGATQKSD